MSCLLITVFFCFFFSFVLYETQTATIKQNREKEKLKVTHDKQLEELANDVQKVSSIDDGWEILTMETVV